MQSIDSPIQNHILSQLKNAKELRYSQLQPRDIPNDLFKYHLQQLVKKEYVTKTEQGYSLSEGGIQHVADPHTQTGAITSLFKVNVITIVSRIVDGEIQILSQVRMSNPSYGKIGVMGGVVRKGEPIEEAATRKLKAETGLEASFKLVSCERRMLYKSDTLFSDVLFPVTYTKESTGTLVADTQFGHNKWVPIDEAIGNESVPFDSIKTIVTILKAIKDGSIETLPFVFEETVQRDTQ